MCARVAACVIALDSMDHVQSDTENKAELSAITPCSQKPARKEIGDVSVSIKSLLSKSDSRTSLVMMVGDEN